MIMVSGSSTTSWQPILIVPLAMAVAMRERELSASVFGAVCGLVIDLAYGRLFGFTGIWLLPGCLTASLLTAHLIKVNFLNFLWLSTAVCTILAAADYFFGYVIWSVPNAHYVLSDFIIPAHLSAVILSPAVYFGVKGISRRFTLHERVHLSSMHDKKDDEEGFK
jgi:cell shape-determining protein MreD